MKKALISIITFVFILQSSFAATEEPVKSNDSHMYVSNDVFLYQVMRYIYRWYLDERDIESNDIKKDLHFLIRELHPKLDAGDKSKYAEIVIPMFRVLVKLKEADYIFDETGQDVKSDDYKIINVTRISLDEIKDSEYISKDIEIDKMRKYLFETRNKEEFPDEKLLERMKVAFKSQLVLLRKKEIKDTLDKEDENIVYIAPLSPVANDLWAYWESGKILIHCYSDIDIDNEEVWRHEGFYFHCYDVYNNTVVSLAEAALSNEYFTRDQVGRILFNCLVLGKRVKLPAE